jgi:hypothetical protein
MGSVKVSVRRRQCPVKAYASVPKLWPNSTVVCIGSGPSLTQEDVDYCRGKARVIVINAAYNYAPWADCLYACDTKFWRWEYEGKKPTMFQGNGLSAHTFVGLKYALEQGAGEFPGVQVLKNTGREGLERQPTSLRTGANSGYQAMNLAVHLGASRIVLLGYDMQAHAGKQHCFGDHPQKSTSPYTAFLGYFATLAPELQKLKIDVVNCSPRSALHCFPKQSLAQALSAPLEMAS